VRTLLLLILLAAPLSAQVIIDNVDAGFSVTQGTWSTGDTAAGRYGADYRFATCNGTAAAPTALAEWRPTLTAGLHEVHVWYPAGSNRPVDAPYVVHHTGGSTVVRVDQTTGGGQWVALGTFDFADGTTGYVQVRNDAELGKVVMADAVRFSPVSPTTAADEFRAVWVSRFEWPSTTPATWKNNINTIMANAKAGNFNAVVLQMRGTTDTLYPSPHEPLSPLITNGTGDDALAYAIAAAHAQGLQLHCYFNTHVCTSTFAAANPSWLIADSSGTPQSSTVDGYYWLAPGHPDVQAYLRTQIMHIVNNYPALDGIHFDRIRMPEPDYSHDAVSTARRTGDGNPAGLAFDPWTADQITRFLRDVYAEVRGVNPTLQLSAAPLGLYAAASYPGYSTGYYYGLPRQQDAKAWLAHGALDWIAPQIYWADGGSKPDFSDIAPDWQASASGRHIYPGISGTGEANSNRASNEITASRNFGCPGTVVWSYGSANSAGYWSGLTQAGAPYEQAASCPDLPWLSNPTTGSVRGVITDFATGLPILDAWITKNGSSYTALSAADGFWCWLDLAPGSHTFTVDAGALGTAVVTITGLSAGEHRTVDIAVAGAGVPTRLELLAPVTTSAQVNQPFAFTVVVVDSQGTPVTTGSHTVTATPVGATGNVSGPLSVATSGGAAVFDFSYDSTGSVTFVFVTTGLQQVAATVNFATTSDDKDKGGGGCAVSTAGTPWWLLAPLLALLRRRKR
jgi:uncharacterized lipoprotein YddW (UPF0748 family)